MHFDMPPYLLGVKGPAQCVEIQPDSPMRIYLVPRDGSEPQVPTSPTACRHLVNCMSCVRPLALCCR